MSMREEVQSVEKLFLIMSDKGEFVYSLYEIIGDSKPNEDETIMTLEKPLLRMEKSIYPEDMSFASIGSQIYMSGGSFCNLGHYTASNKVFVYDTITSTIVTGPEMNFAKNAHYLFNFGTKLFALSKLIYESGDEEGNLNPKPTFEVWDTNDIESKWCNLPMPILRVTELLNVYSVCAIAAVLVARSENPGCFIFISVENAGSYAFDVDNSVWSYVGDFILPFSEQAQAQTIPHDPYLCCAHSLESNKFCAFRFSDEVGENNKLFKVEEIKVDTSYRFFPFLPRLQRCRPWKTVLGPNGRVYFIASGRCGRFDRDRYVKVSALGFCGPKLDLTMDKMLKNCLNEKKHGNMDDDLEQDDNELAMTGKWRLCYFGGSVCDELIHVAGAFAM